MIKINVLLKDINWRKYLKNPNSYVDKNISIINKKSKKYTKKILICSLLLSGSKEIKYLNKKFRSKNRSTDVLSFPFYEKKKLNKKIKKEKEIYIGDIIININKIKNKNSKFKFKLEFNKLWIHGLVHLFGYNHKKDKDFKVMSNIEKQYLEYIY